MWETAFPLFCVKGENIMYEDLYTKDWAMEIMETAGSELASAETQDQVLSVLHTLANSLDDFLGNFMRIKTQIENLQLKNTIVKNYRRQINSANMEDFMKNNFDESASDAQAIILYTQLLSQMAIGYYLINKIRDILFEPITYAVGFYGDSDKNVEYISNLTLEDILEGTMSLSTRIRMSDINFARLEVDLKEVIKELQEKKMTQQASDDPLYNEIIAYTSSHKHTYQNRDGKWRSKTFAMGHLWETYRYMKLNQIEFSDGALQSIYEEVRKGNLAYYKGGDVLSEQDKFGNQVALKYMAAIVTQMPLIIEGLREINAESISSKLQAIFIQQLTDKADQHLKDYVEKDIDKLLSVLKIKD
jgi:ribosomal protein L12E/L44/L45/RPP1/RPP2